MKTNAQLQNDVLEELRWEPSFDAAKIGVQAHDGVVTLTGEVGSFTEKWNAERAAQRVAGVQVLAVELEVRLPDSARHNDEDIGRDARTILSWTSAVPKDAVQVLVDSGWVTLSGEVDWQFQRQAAASAVRHLPGVTGLSNQISIGPSRRTVAVRKDIEAALHRRAALEARGISVIVKGDEVTLVGRVHSWAERELADQTAWASPGVRHVVDQLKIHN